MIGSLIWHGLRRLHEDAEDSKRLNALAGELYNALAARDFKQARRYLSKIRAEIKYQDWMPEPGSTKLKFKRSPMEDDVEFAALYLCDTLGAPANQSRNLREGAGASEA